MKDIREQVLDNKKSGSLYIDENVVDGSKDSVLDAMDEYAIKILQLIIDNRIYSSIGQDTDTAALLTHIKTELK